MPMCYVTSHRVELFSQLTTDLKVAVYKINANVTDVEDVKNSYLECWVSWKGQRMHTPLTLLSIWC